MTRTNREVYQICCLRFFELRITARETMRLVAIEHDAPTRENERISSACRATRACLRVPLCACVFRVHFFACMFAHAFLADAFLRMPVARAFVADALLRFLYWRVPFGRVLFCARRVSLECLAHASVWRVFSACEFWAREFYARVCFRERLVRVSLCASFFARAGCASFLFFLRVDLCALTCAH